MTLPKLYKFSRNGKFFAVDPQNTFCFECDEITYDVVEYYPDTPINKVIELLSNKYSESEIKEVWGELEFLRVTGLILKREKLESWAKELTTPPSLNKITICIDNTLVDDSAISKLISKSIVRALPNIKNSLKIKLEVFFLSDFRSLDECRDKIASIKDFLPSSLNNNLSVTYIFPLPLELAEDWKLSTEDRIFIHIPFSEVENTFYKVEIFPVELDITSIVKKLIDKKVTEIKVHFESLFVLTQHYSLKQIFDSIQELSDFYSEVLRKGNYVIINPITDLLTRVQKGNPNKLSDHAGISYWFISPVGEIYGGYLYYLSKLGKIGNIDTTAPPDNSSVNLLNRGVDIVPACINCWAKHFCGGGNPITHYQFTKKFNLPHKEWCILQRNWIEYMIAKFQELGDIDFSTIGKSHVLQKDIKIGKLTVLKHIFQRFFTEKLYIRPLKPQDEAILSKWENWNTATYYTFFESSVLTTTMFEKEQEILNAQKGYEEYLIIDSKNTPRGLVRIRPDRVPNVYYVWLYFHNSEDYESKSVLSSFQEIISYLRELTHNAKFLFPCLREEEKLSNFLQKCGMKKLATFRESVFYHKSYHDVDIYAL